MKGFLDRVDELAKPDRDLPCRVAVCEKYIDGDPESFRGVLVLFSNDLVHTALGRRLQL